MRREHLLFATTCLLTLASGLLVVRWLAPSLLGVPPDLQLVQLDEKLPAFYDGVFRPEELRSSEFIVKDPLLVHRARPFFPDRGTMGPNDALGFRNRSVPLAADIVALGDSQTYGNNALLELSWPQQLASRLGERASQTYGAAVGGWASAQYLEMFPKLLFLRPRVVVVAFYTGNDPLESFAHVYGNERWADLRPDPNLSPKDAPPGRWQDRRQPWHVDLGEGFETRFTPRQRLRSNLDHPAVHAGYQIMAETGRRLAIAAQEAEVFLVLTVIPTKELVFAPRVAAHGLEAPEAYQELVRLEAQRLSELATALAGFAGDGLAGAQYVDVLGPLQEAAMGTEPLYPASIDGHPLAAGYAVIADALAPTVAELLPLLPRGGVLVSEEGTQRRRPLLLRDGAWWAFANSDLMRANGWRHAMLQPISERDLIGMPFGGEIRDVAPQFSPENNPPR